MKISLRDQKLFLYILSTFCFFLNYDYALSYHDHGTLVLKENIERYFDKTGEVYQFIKDARHIFLHENGSLYITKLSENGSDIVVDTIHGKYSDAIIGVIRKNINALRDEDYVAIPSNSMKKIAFLSNYAAQDFLPEDIRNMRALFSGETYISINWIFNCPGTCGDGYKPGFYIITPQNVNADEYELTYASPNRNPLIKVYISKEKFFSLKNIIHHMDKNEIFIQFPDIHIYGHTNQRSFKMELISDGIPYHYTFDTNSYRIFSSFKRMGELNNISLRLSIDRNTDYEVWPLDVKIEVNNFGKIIDKSTKSIPIFFVLKKQEIEILREFDSKEYIKESIIFVGGSKSITEKERNKIDILLKKFFLLKNYGRKKVTKILIKGYADDSKQGGRITNFSISEFRAKAVRDLILDISIMSNFINISDNSVVADWFSNSAESRADVDILFYLEKNDEQLKRIENINSSFMEFTHNEGFWVHNKYIETSRCIGYGEFSNRQALQSVVRAFQAEGLGKEIKFFHERTRESYWIMETCPQK